MSAQLIKGDTFRDRSMAVLTPTRGMIHVDAYCAHMGLDWPPNIRKVFIVASGHEVSRAYNELFAAALKSNFRYALTVEDDMLPPVDAVTRLCESIEAHPELSAVSAFYRTKGSPSLPLILGHPDVPGDHVFRSPVEGAVVECNAIPMGLAIWKLDMFRSLPSPWFKTTRDTQDVHFARTARAAGHRFAVDCTIKAGHLDVSTGHVY